MKTLMCCLLLAAPLAAQRDFLTQVEIARVQEAEGPSARLVLYASFARQRVDLVKNLLSKEKVGRSVIIHDALDDYSRILDAIDDTVDNALAHKVDVKAGMNAVANAEQQMLPALRKFKASQPKDLERYVFALDQAIETTSDSLDASLQDPRERALDNEARENREKKEAESAMTPAERDEKKAADQKTADQKTADDGKQQKKAPTLLRPGEKPQQQP
jgi:type II secretory pathway component GspD/PulD (secretin)